MCIERRITLESTEMCVLDDFNLYSNQVLTLEMECVMCQLCTVFFCSFSLSLSLSFSVCLSGGNP